MASLLSNTAMLAKLTLRSKQIAAVQSGTKNKVATATVTMWCASLAETPSFVKRSGVTIILWGDSPVRSLARRTTRSTCPVTACPCI